MVFNKYQGNPFARTAKCEKRKVSVSERKLREMRNAKWREKRNWTFVMGLDIFVGGKKSDLTKKNWTFSSLDNW